MQTQQSEQERWRLIAVKLIEQVGGRNKLAKMLKINAPYLGRIIRREKPIADNLINRVRELHFGCTSEVHQSYSNPLRPRNEQDKRGKN